MATDLRASVTLVIAGLIWEGERAYRGSIILTAVMSGLEKLSAVGAKSGGSA